jgi:hypothetical protein
MQKSWCQELGKIKEEIKMIKNLKDLIIVALVIGVLSLLGVIIIGDYYVALQENRPVDESVITLMKMALTGLIGIIAGYVGSK